MAEEKKSDLSRAFSEDGALKTHVGGQALLEGIMMRGKLNWAVAVREPEGTIYTEEHDLASGKDKNGWLYWPFIRGCRAFVESLALGYKALSISAEHAFVEEVEAEQEGDAPAALENGEAAEPEPLRTGELPERPGAEASRSDFSWSRDFGNPDEMIDALGAQRTLEVVTEPAGEGEPRWESEPEIAGELTSESNRGNEIEPASERESELAYVSEPERASRQEAAGESAGVGVSEPLAAGESNAEAPKAASQPAAEKKPLLGDTEMAISMVLGLVLGVALFIVVPAFVTNLIVGEYDERTLLWNIVDGLLRIAIFIFYIWLIGRMSDIKRMFGYHGAEHKTIHCFEHGLPLTPENARSFPRLHVRCGTAFLIMVMIIAIFIYTITPIDALIAAWGVPDGVPKLVLVIVVRILLMPVIAGVAYEITVKWAGSHPDNPLVKVILWPGMQMQYLTTREPDDGQIECAIAAMQLVLEREQLEEVSA